MTKRLLIGVAAMLSVGVALQAQRFEQVEYFSDSILKADEGLIRLLGGSSWILSTASTVLAAQDVVIVIRDVAFEGSKPRVAMAYVDGQELVVNHARGTYATSKGYLTSVVEARRDGALLVLADGSLWSVPEYDRYDTSWWLPPYQALVASNRLYLYNLKKRKRVWVNQVK